MPILITNYKEHLEEGETRYKSDKKEYAYLMKETYKGLK